MSTTRWRIVQLIQNLVSHFLRIMACQHSFTVSWFCFLYNTSFDVARSSLILQSSKGSMISQDRAFSLEIRFVPKKQKESSKFTPHRSNARLMILTAESARYLFASNLTHRVHENRFFTLLVGNIYSGLTTAQRFGSVEIFSRG